MTTTSNKGIIVQINATVSEFNTYVAAGNFTPKGKVLFFKQTDGYVMCDVRTNKGVSEVKVIIVGYFRSK